MTTASAEAARQIESLTERQREVLDRVLAGDASKNIATILGSAHGPWKITAPPSCKRPAPAHFRPWPAWP